MRIDALTGVVATQTTKSTSASQAVKNESGAVPMAAPEAPAASNIPAEAAESVAAAAKQIESYLKSVGRTLEFRVDGETNRTVVTVRDADSGEVIRQIPGDEVLKLARHLQSLGGSVNFKV